MSFVSFVRIQESNINAIKQAITESLDLIDYSFRKEVKNVVIKPNMCYYWDYSTGQTTDPRFVAEVIRILRETISPNMEISVVESDASAMKCRYAFKFLGYEKMAEECGVKLLNLSEVETEQVKVEVGNRRFNFMVPQIIRNADLRINIPKMKYMSFSKISCALKNIFGCNPNAQKFKYHLRMSETIVGLNKAMPFDLCILDGIIVLGCRVSKLGLVMASRDPVAMDTAAAMIAGVNPKSVEHIMLAEKEHIGKASFIAKGMNSSYFEDRYPAKNLTSGVIELGYRLVHVFNLEERLML